MKIKDLSSYKTDEILTLMQRIPFFKELQQQEEGQLECLLDYSCIVELSRARRLCVGGIEALGYIFLSRGAWLFILIPLRMRSP